MSFSTVHEGRSSRFRTREWIAERMPRGGSLEASDFFLFLGFLGAGMWRRRRAGSFPAGKVDFRSSGERAIAVIKQGTILGIVSRRIGCREEQP